MQEQVLQHLLQRCTVEVDDTSALTPEEFTLVRRNGFGASDASVYLGLMSKWRSVDDLIQQKLALTQTQEERDVFDKIQVQLGIYLEPYILKLFADNTDQTVVKPKQMFRFRDYPYLTVNYDGITCGGWMGDAGPRDPINAHPIFVPVECKVVTLGGDRYYNWALDQPDERPSFPTECTLASIERWCEQMAQIYGIPAYYYAQVQQEMMGLDAPYGYLAALRLKNCTFKIFKIPADPWVQNAIIIEGNKASNRLERERQRR